MKISDLDDILGTPARLVIIATLAQGQQLTFTALGRETGIADGNLHVQTGKLVAAGYLARERIKSGGRNATRFEITQQGRLAFREYVQRLHEAGQPTERPEHSPSGAKSYPKSDPARFW